MRSAFTLFCGSYATNILDMEPALQTILWQLGNYHIGHRVSTSHYALTVWVSTTYCSDKFMQYMIASDVAVIIDPKK